MPTEMELTLEQTQQGVGYEVSNIRVILLTVKMEILLEPTSNKLMVGEISRLAGSHHTVLFALSAAPLKQNGYAGLGETLSRIFFGIIPDHKQHKDMRFELRFPIGRSLKRNEAHRALSDVCGGVSSAPKRSTMIRFGIPQRRSTRLTRPAPVPTVDKVNRVIIQEQSNKKVLDEHKSQEE
ncbi:hypothetical protein Tco_0364304 [Tanacetum coccineum]